MKKTRIKTLISFALSLTAAAIMAFSSVFACADEVPDFNVEVNAPPKIAFLGDSITAGYGLDGYSNEDKTKCSSYANILSMVFGSMLPEEAGFESQNMGINGLTSSKMLKKLKDGYYDKALADADAVVVSIGGNDMLGVFRDLLDSENSVGDIIKQAVTLSSDIDKKMEPYPDNLEQISEEIHSRTHKDDCILFIQTLYNPFEGHTLSVLDDLADEKITSLNETIFSKSDNGENYLVADVADAFKGRNSELTNISRMDIHPNADGHEVIAKTLEPLIEGQTYTYYDYKAEQEYELEMRKKAEQETERKKNILTAVCAAAAFAAISAAAAAIIHAIKKRTK